MFLGGKQRIYSHLQSFLSESQDISSMHRMFADVRSKLEA